MKKETDQEIIARHGGPAELARKLSYSPGRVGNWVSRGIPSGEKLEHPKLLMPRMKKAAKKK